MVRVVFVAVLVLYSARYVINRPWTARDRVAAVALEGKIYVLGGRDQERLLDEVIQIDPVTGGTRSLKMRSFLRW